MGWVAVLSIKDTRKNAVSPIVLGYLVTEELRSQYEVNVSDTRVKIIGLPSRAVAEDVAVALADQLPKDVKVFLYLTAPFGQVYHLDLSHLTAPTLRSKLAS